MGNRAEAILVYGVPLDPETEFGEWDYGDPKTGPAWLSQEYRAAEEGVSMEMYGHYDSRTYVLAAEGTEKRADWNDTTPIASLDVTPTQRAAVVAYAQKHGLRTRGEPGWYLVAYYG
jgi:hypothetical protein